jgi:hypothetical protein
MINGEIIPKVKILREIKVGVSKLIATVMNEQTYALGKTSPFLAISILYCVQDYVRYVFPVPVMTPHTERHCASKCLS